MEKYIKLETLGHGTYGSVILVKSMDKKKYAMKRILIENDDAQSEKIENEIKILNNLDHENIIKYIESFTHKKKFCIVMEYADGGDLQTIIKNNIESNTLIEEERIWNWIYQLMKALEHIHSKKIIHRDIKGQNILLTKTGIIKLGDFGVSKILENTHDFAKTSLGTPYFLSPEICSGSVYNNKSDVWMLGCVIYECCSLKKPFEADTFHNLMKVIINNKQMPIPKKYSQDLCNLVETILEKNPNIRPSIVEISEMDIVRRNFARHVTNNEKLKENKAKFESGSKEFENKFKNGIENNYPSNATMSTNPEILSPQVNNLSNSIINLQNFVLVKEKFNTYKKDILKKKYSPSLNNDEMQRIINNLEISPLQIHKDTNDTNNFELGITPFDLERKSSKEFFDKEKSEKDEKSKNEAFLALSAKKKVENKFPLAGKRGHARQISFNISSSQYMVNETLDSCSHKQKNHSAMKIEAFEDNLIKKNFVNSHKNLNELISKNKNLELNVNFVINKIGREKFSFLIECIEQSENPFEFITNSEVAQKICGKDFNGVVNMLKKIIITALSSPNVK